MRDFNWALSFSSEFVWGNMIPCLDFLPFYKADIMWRKYLKYFLVDDKSPISLHIQYRHTKDHGIGNHGPSTRYLKLRVLRAPGMLRTFSPPPRVNDPDMHHGTCMPGSLSGFLWSQWRGKRSRQFRRMRNPQFYVSGKRSMVLISFPEYSGLSARGDRVIVWWRYQIHITSTWVTYIQIYIYFQYIHIR